MEWAERWRMLASHDLMTGSSGEGRMVERWTALARRLDAPGEQRPDPIFDFVVSHLDSTMSAIDIGAGIGRWTIPLASHVRQVTAVEPVDGMRAVLADRLAARDLKNVRIVPAPWQDAELHPHEVAIAAYSMYTSPDLAAFAAKMDATATQFCFMSIRLPAHDGVMGELSLKIHGDWHDSPNFVVGYNALLEAGFTPNVFIEPRALSYWNDASFDDALARARRHLGLHDSTHDTLIADTLERRLVETPDGLRWPDWTRSAVVWWPAGQR